MSLRAVPASWFELLVARPWLGHVLQVLAATGRVEFESCESEAGRIDVEALRDRLAGQDRLLTRYLEYRPTPEFRPLKPEMDFERISERALGNLQIWCDKVAPLVERLEQIDRRRLELIAIRHFLERLTDVPEFNLERLRASHPGLRWFLHTAASDQPTPTLSEVAFLRRYDTPYESFFLIALPHAGAEQGIQELMAHKLKPVPIPDGIGGEASAARESLVADLERLEREARTLRDEIARLASRHHVAAASGDLLRLQWLFEHLGEVGVTEHLARVTGWTDDFQGAVLKQTIDAEHIPAVIDLRPAPEGKVPPTVIRNPVWARPFELFERLVGTPALGEPDPSRVLALAVPLLFGYMFGDVGQGAVILLAGWLLSSRWRLAAVLIPAGLSSVAFGFVFGSVFGSEHLIPALWVHPLEDPLPVLLVPIFCGGLLILIGMSLAGLASRWTGTGLHWLKRESGLMGCLLGGFLMVIDFLAGATLFALGALWFLGGHVLNGTNNRCAAMLKALGELAERLLQLLVNTVSFVRVGAFALAHAGLGLAVVSIAEGTDNVVLGALVMVLGNLAIVALEGLVVSIQTTRLILFEFFVRFFRAEGRLFLPTRPPPLR
ncbi:MAG: hypothetical protein R3200_14805 [Xanthomonadales bacterium]|nr:hypothetical protein [Xanthomonadales bacterium]